MSRSPSPPKKKKPKKADDVVLLGDNLPDGQGRAVLRFREGKVEAGAVRPMEEGKPIAGEIVTLKPREECPAVCDVEVQLSQKELATASRGRPAQVATDRYRKNWDTIYKRRKPKLSN